MKKFTVVRNRESEKVCKYTAAVREYISDQMTPAELEAHGQDVFTGSERMLAHLRTIDLLAKYDKPAAWNEFLSFMDANLDGMSIVFHD